MENSTKQLSLSQRIKIEDMLNQGCRKYEIVKEIGKNQSTIAIEINKHKILKPYNPLKHDNTYNCKVCTRKCRIYQPISCKDIDRNIGACNNCPNIKSCKLDKYFYRAEKAQNDYEYTLRDSRQGVNLNTYTLKCKASLSSIEYVSIFTPFANLLLPIYLLS